MSMTLLEEEEGLVENVAGPRTSKRWIWVSGVAAAVMAVTGLAIHLQPRRPTMVQRLSSFQKGLEKAFSVRALSEDPTFTAISSFVMKEENSPDPDKMKITSVIKKSESDAVEDFGVKTTFIAKEGKTDELLQKFKDIKDVVIRLQGEEAGQEAQNMADSMVEIVADGDDVVIKVKLPDMPPAGKEVEKDLLASPKLTFELSTGRDLVEMFQKRDVNLVALPGGIKATVNMAVAASVFKALKEAGIDRPPAFGPDPADMLAGFSKVSTHSEMLYKPEDDLSSIWKTVPTLAQLLQHAPPLPVPAAVLEALKGLDEVVDGLKRMELVGCPEKWEVVVDFTNVHITPLVVAALEEMKPKASLWSSSE
jgi:hypothetical protein